MALGRFLYETELFLGDSTTRLVGTVRTLSISSGLTVDGDANSPPEGVDPTTNMPIRVSGTRKYGITARHITLTRTLTSGAIVQRIYRKVVIFDPAFFVTAVSHLAPTIEYAGLDDWILAGARQESYHLNFQPPA